MQGDTTLCKQAIYWFCDYLLKAEKPLPLRKRKSQGNRIHMVAFAISPPTFPTLLFYPTPKPPAPPHTCQTRALIATIPNPTIKNQAPISHIFLVAGN